MEIIQKSKNKYYTVRCFACKSVFKMDKKEFDASHKGGVPRFDCPICEKQSFACKTDIHCFVEMEDGSTYQSY